VELELEGAGIPLWSFGVDVLLELYGIVGYGRKNSF